MREYFNTAAFIQAAIGTFGNVGRNSLRGPAFFDVDASIFKNFVFTERFRLQFRAEAFNIQNRANFNNPNATVSAGVTFGTITAAADPRVMQFALKMFFYLLLRHWAEGQSSCPSDAFNYVGLTLRPGTRFPRLHRRCGAGLLRLANPNWREVITGKAVPPHGTILPGADNRRE